MYRSHGRDFSYMLAAAILVLSTSRCPASIRPPQVSYAFSYSVSGDQDKMESFYMTYRISNMHNSS